MVTIGDEWEIQRRLEQGEVGILPTDTLYGLSGNALTEDVVERILAIKRRRAPMSIIPHSLEWASGLVAQQRLKEFLEAATAYQGPYTLLWPVSAPELPQALWSSGCIGFRWPRHWISELATRLGFPLVTTSVNAHGEAPMTRIEDLTDELRALVDFAVDEGPKAGAASILVDASVSPYRVISRA